ncbi:UNKNOWN [Stylonychia lemnae]|uniref:Uncharacterized protein n=1 Tax=Stylonychia lemnae TaxID=5949 RepID=A0A078AUQ1_STYLE|nr:UNKNOWN [Stylonychia lemnae]|eukprot:CDW86130.1 UNKNOWN [Stylonychia lemnae]
MIAVNLDLPSNIPRYWIPPPYVLWHCQLAWGKRIVLTLGLSLILHVNIIVPKVSGFMGSILWLAAGKYISECSKQKRLKYFTLVILDDLHAVISI